MGPLFESLQNEFTRWSALLQWPTETNLPNQVLMSLSIQRSVFWYISFLHNFSCLVLKAYLSKENCVGHTWRIMNTWHGCLYLLTWCIEYVKCFLYISLKKQNSLICQCYVFVIFCNKTIFYSSNIVIVCYVLFQCVCLSIVLVISYNKQIKSVSGLILIFSYSTPVKLFT